MGWCGSGAARRSVRHPPRPRAPASRTRSRICSFAPPALLSCRWAEASSTGWSTSSGRRVRLPGRLGHPGVPGPRRAGRWWPRRAAGRDIAEANDALLERTSRAPSSLEELRDGSAADPRGEVPAFSAARGRGIGLHRSPTRSSTCCLARRPAAMGRRQPATGDRGARQLGGAVRPTFKRSSTRSPGAAGGVVSGSRRGSQLVNSVKERKRRPSLKIEGKKQPQIAAAVAGDMSRSEAEGDPSG